MPTTRSTNRSQPPRRLSRYDAWMHALSTATTPPPFSPDTLLKGEPRRLAGLRYRAEYREGKHRPPAHYTAVKWPFPFVHRAPDSWRMHVTPRVGPNGKKRGNDVSIMTPFGEHRSFIAAGRHRACLRVREGNETEAHELFILHDLMKHSLPQIYNYDRTEPQGMHPVEVIRVIEVEAPGETNESAAPEWVAVVVPDDESTDSDPAYCNGFCHSLSTCGDPPNCWYRQPSDTGSASSGDWRE